MLGNGSFVPFTLIGECPTDGAHANEPLEIS
jgi:hypothetical protein